MDTRDKESLESMIKIIDKIRTIEEQVKELDKEIDELNESSNIMALINLPSKKSKAYFYETKHELQQMIFSEEQIINLQNKFFTKDRQENTYKVGDVLQVVENIRVLYVNGYHKVDVKGYDEYYKNNLLVVLENVDNYNFILARYVHDIGVTLIFATKPQLDAYTEKTKSRCKYNIIKLDFTVNGPDPLTFAKKLSKIKLFENGCQERKGSDYYYDDNWACQESKIINVTGDETFGIIGSAYFIGKIKPNYQSIVTTWSNLNTGFTVKGRIRKNDYDANKVGFHKKDDQTYRYNSKISYFVPNNYPKDFFVDKGVKDKLFNILSISQIISTEELVDAEA